MHRKQPAYSLLFAESKRVELCNYFGMQIKNIENAMGDL